MAIDLRPWLAAGEATASDHVKRFVYQRNEEERLSALPHVLDQLPVKKTVQGTDMAPDPKSIPSANELAQQMQLDASPLAAPEPPAVAASDAPLCMQCGVHMQRAGSCFACPSCGSTSGCS